MEQKSNYDAMLLKMEKEFLNYEDVYKRQGIRRYPNMYTSKKPYHYGTGRRKSSVARVHLFPGGTGAITINGRDIDDYFGLDTLKLIVRQPLNTTDTIGKVDIVATVTGGGVTGQAGAIRHGISRALLLMDESYRPALKAAGFLTRDPRMKERKKYGLKACLLYTSKRHAVTWRTPAVYMQIITAGWDCPIQYPKTSSRK